MGFEAMSLKPDRGLVLGLEKAKMVHHNGKMTKTGTKWIRDDRQGP
jgi:hypothetical protein